MAQQSWTNVTIQATGSFAPNSVGWDTTILPAFATVGATITLQPADLTDATLKIEVDVECTNDPTGASGWMLLQGNTFQLGPTGRDQTSKQPIVGPFSVSSWPPMQRMRFHAIPTRTVTHVDATVTAI